MGNDGASLFKSGVVCSVVDQVELEGLVVNLCRLLMKKLAFGLELVKKADKQNQTIKYPGDPQYFAGSLIEDLKSGGGGTEKETEWDHQSYRTSKLALLLEDRHPQRKGTAVEPTNQSLTQAESSTPSPKQWLGHILIPKSKRSFASKLAMTSIRS
ncbi:hypothetical protein CROQUDRAFT_87204 [Cronartium quercuum f. sp. fusiforme G11]|uniref:Uncharacterized protein n=1 Tax=Cronartium quercuum f. sp. fusiforme G11 TaxID=708437 RepID=A0A9P6NVI4_9BASI|nr:hypothetical protein CROQUDRAFT_87204 [Cronartium quercuum f. sp. fusiforme G11]